MQSLSPDKLFHLRTCMFDYSSQCNKVSNMQGISRQDEGVFKFDFRFRL